MYFFSLSLFLRILFDVVFPLKKKNMGISGAMVPEKTCTSRLCTHEHTINVIAPTLRETVIYTFQTAVCRCLSNTSLLPLTLETLCVGFFLLAFCFVLYNRLHEFVFIASRRYESLFFTFSCSGCHYYTHIYIIIYKKLGVRRTGRALLFFFTRSLK